MEQLEYHKEKKRNGAEEISELMTENIAKLIIDTKAIDPKSSENTKNIHISISYSNSWKKTTKVKTISQKKLGWDYLTY